MISLFSENVFVPRKFFEVVLYNVISKIGCKWLKQGEKLHLFLVLSLSAILHGYDAVLGGVHRKKKFPFTVTPLWCTESCLAEMQTWLPPVGVCHDCVVLLLLLHWVLGSAEWAQGQKHSEGDDPWASCHTSNTEKREKFSRNSVVLVLRNAA